ncbi:hypothetical protein [Neopusillimonas aromaticivorans]|uniref:hypothetical protein n=1 Tax=Neopusillimonas aromaticivorans TaxID=2979868 RepID=UPI0033153968
MTPLLLVINAGSSSLKFQVFEQDSPRTIAKVMGGRFRALAPNVPISKLLTISRSSASIERWIPIRCLILHRLRPFC